MAFRTTLRLAFVAILGIASLLGGPACRAQDQSAGDSAVQFRDDDQEAGQVELLYRRRKSIGGRGVQSESLSDAFLLGVGEVSRRIGCQPGDLIAVMMRESGLRADAWNRSSNAVGLIQFLPSTLARVGWPDSWERFRALSAEEQLPWVERYLRPYSRYGLNTVGRLYQAVFMPISLRGQTGAETSLIDSRGSSDGRYQNNRGLDLNGDGRITVGELRQSVEHSFRTAAWQTIEARLRDLEGGGRSSRIASARPARRADMPALTEPSRPAALRTARLRDAARRSDDTGMATLPAQYRDEDDAPRNPEEGAPVDLRSAEGVSEALSALGFDARRLSLGSAVRAFQRSVGLACDGAVGRRTRAAIESELQASGLATAL